MSLKTPFKDVSKVPDEVLAEWLATLSDEELHVVGLKHIDQHYLDLVAKHHHLNRVLGQKRRRIRELEMRLGADAGTSGK